MSEKEKPQHESAEVENLTLEIQRTGIAIMTAHRHLGELEAKIEELRKRRDEIRGGQRVFKLDE